MYKGAEGLQSLNPAKQQAHLIVHMESEVFEMKATPSLYEYDRRRLLCIILWDACLKNIIHLKLILTVWFISNYVVYCKFKKKHFKKMQMRIGHCLLVCKSLLLY